ncbi:threonine/serine exporter family protein, partial [Haemophilus influenzae]|uniref:threonine/serine exporter family protein n=1 Tax=Haemophilus influenzae TaxID=727 RepID=UPI000CC806D1
PAVVFILAILAPLVPGYLSYRTTAFFVTGDYNKALASATLVVMLALVISIGMASGTVIVSQILSILYKTPAVVFILAILAPLVPGYLSYRTTAFFVTGDYN